MHEDFEILATLLRLRLCFRYEVIERFDRLVRIRAEVLRQLREAMERIKNEAFSLGPKESNHTSPLALFHSEEDRKAMEQLHDTWGEARRELFSRNPLPGRGEVARVLARMLAMNYGFIRLGSCRFHGLIDAGWVEFS